MTNTELRIKELGALSNGLHAEGNALWAAGKQEEAIAKFEAGNALWDQALALYATIAAS
ncbi:hypothetical protein KMC49_gp01 [Ralstonia phage Firinga]|uniref:Tetratricopeptide repeat protein n=1 Tax=Ralstonia phage Firinga TaxID=2759725 RepID=A0A7G5B9U6_9CAUD|nr:hypothetical protein KMC49_gp01 [Ralstonia phage Firinga]QMV33069.1 hypothetical protein 18C_00001 [Ralstonia phage Firinga]